MKKLTLLDTVIVIFFFIAMIILFVNNFIFKKDTYKELLIETPHGKYYYSLNQVKVIELKGTTGITKIKIDKGKFHFIDSPCLHKDCIKMGWISYSNYPVVCLPNNVSGFIISKKSNIEFDDVSR